MRIRSIKPEFFQDPDLTEFPFVNRLTFAGLWLVADGHGRLEDRPRRLRGQLFPFDQDVDMEAILDQLAAPPGRFIIRYEVGGERLIQIRNFRKHQRITGKEFTDPSRFPAPPGESTGKQSGNNPEPPAASPLLQEREREREMEREEEEERETPSAPPPAPGMLSLDPYQVALGAVGVIDPGLFGHQLNHAMFQKAPDAFDLWSSWEAQKRADWLTAALDVADARRPGEGRRVAALVAGILLQALQDGKPPTVNSRASTGNQPGNNGETVEKRSDNYEEARGKYIDGTIARTNPGAKNHGFLVQTAIRDGSLDVQFHRAIRIQAADLAKKLAELHPQDAQGRRHWPTQFPLAGLVDQLKDDEGR